MIKLISLKELLTQNGRPADRLSEAEVKFYFFYLLIYSSILI